MAKLPYQKLTKLADKETYRMIKDGAVIDVGGDDAIFTPEVHMSKWQGECWLKISHKDKDKVKKTYKVKEIAKADKIELELDINGTGRTHRFKEGSLKWEIIYNSVDDLPENDIEEFALEFPYDQLSFYEWIKVPQSDIDSGMIEPEWAINSFMGFLNKSGVLLDPDGNEVYNYGTGKFCHIQRSEMIAADGSETWVTQEISDNKLKVSIPRQWCIDHGFPCVLDPTIGTDGVGAGINTTANRVRGIHKDADGNYLSVSSTADKFDKMYVYTGVASVGFTAGVYDHDGADAPDNLVDSASGTSVLNGWVEVDLGADVSATQSAKYSIAAAWGTVINAHYDSVGNAYYVGANTSVLSDPFSGVVISGFLYSIYLSYTESGGSSSLPKELICKFDIYNQMSKEMIGKFDILNSLSTEKIFKFDIHNQVSKEIVSKFDIRNEISKELIAKFDILSDSLQVSKELVAKFDIHNEISKELISKFDIHNLVSKEAIVKFDIHNEVSKELIAKFDIREEVSKELIAVFDMGGSVEKTLVCVFNIEGVGSSGILIIGGNERGIKINNGVLRIG